MNWSEIGKSVAKAAPLIGGLLGGPAGGAVGVMVASAVGVDNDPAAVANALQADPAALTRIRELELTRAAELQRMQIEAETARLGEINRTIRAEAASNDAYVRRWRPTYGYAAAFTWSAQMIALMIIVGYVVVKAPTSASTVISALAGLLGPLMVLWGVALSILGVSIAKRSQDKQIAAGQQLPPGLLSVIAQRFAGRQQNNLRD